LTTFSSVNYNTDTVWNQVTAALNSNFLVGCDTSSSSEYALPASHAYSVIGAYPLVNTAGTTVYRLLHVRNPWGMDVGYWNGPWSVGSSSWTTAYENQVPYSTANNGDFFIEVGDFVNAFYYYQIGMAHDNWHHSYYSKTGDTGAAAVYSFTTTQAQELYVMGDLYDFRMYPNGCKTYYT
jgi:Calpain family cysteine protease